MSFFAVMRMYSNVDVVGLVAHDATKRILCFVAHVKIEKVTKEIES